MPDHVMPCMLGGPCSTRKSARRVVLGLRGVTAQLHGMQLRLEANRASGSLGDCHLAVTLLESLRCSPRRVAPQGTGDQEQRGAGTGQRKEKCAGRAHLV